MMYMKLEGTGNMTRTKTRRPYIPKAIQEHLWLRAGGRCEFRGCNKLLYEDDVTHDPINESNIAHIVSWTESGPRGDKVLSPKLAIDIDNLMLTCPEHNHLIDTGENVARYTITELRKMKREHEEEIRMLTSLRKRQPKCVIELKSLIHGQYPSITKREESDALFPFYPETNPIVIDLCDVDTIDEAKMIIDTKVRKYIANSDEDKLYAAFIMALIPYGCYLGYSIGNKCNVQTFQHFRDTEDWRWRSIGGGYTVEYPVVGGSACSDVKLFINISGVIDSNLTTGDYPVYAISAENPGFSFLQSWNQVEDFRSLYRGTLDKIRHDHGEAVTIHLYLATPNPINFEIGKCIMKKLDPTIILYDKSDKTTSYVEVMHLHERITP